MYSTMVLILTDFIEWISKLSIAGWSFIVSVVRGSRCPSGVGGFFVPGCGVS